MRETSATARSSPATGEAYVVHGTSISLPVTVRDATSISAVYFVPTAAAQRLVGHPALQLYEIVPGRAVCVLAARTPREADEMASVLQVISSIEGIANAACDVARIVTHRLGIPRELVADLSNAEEVSHRVWVRENSHLARRPLADLDLHGPARDVTE